jgi:choline dehydrogenase-like flavoprotein
MIIDIRRFESGTTFDADICIIGAGAAGITIALQLSNTKYRVVLLESGGYRRETRVQDLYAGDSIGEKYFEGLQYCRTRCFGGSTNCWGGICTPLNEIDFEKRPWVPWSGWPIAYSELIPWLRQAHDICGPGPFLYDSRAWEEIGLEPSEFDSSLFTPFVWHYNSRVWSRNFGRKFRQELTQSENVRVLLHANATELLTDASVRRLERVRIQTLEGKVNHVKARAFVLACGGIENARLLLASKTQCPAGLGNDQDLVGRFFHEHLSVPCGMLLTSSCRAKQDKAALLSKLSRLGGTFCLPGLSLTPSVQAKCKALNGSISFDPVYGNDSAWTALERVRRGWKSKRLDRRVLRDIETIACDCGPLLCQIWQRIAHGDRPRGAPDRYFVFARAEQAPNPNSRVILSNEVDQLGMRRSCLEWRTTHLDRQAIRLMAQFAETELSRLKFGEMIPATWLGLEEWPEDLAGGPHHMGTTRMSDDPGSGVVDRDCRVHALHGLYIAGSSVFPTGGHANPTMSIVALAIRLAAHLKAVLSREVMIYELENVGAIQA